MQLLSMTAKLKKFIDLTRFEQTLFGMPFVLIGGLLPFFNRGSHLNPLENWKQWSFILPAFIAARVSGISFNQYFDRHIDSLNPRTKNRPVASGRISEKYALKVACFSLLLFLLCALCINKFCFFLSCFSGFLLVLYSLMKRIHFSCHLVLGLIHFMGPLTAYIAIGPSLSLPIIFLALVAFFLNAGNDILYALQDYSFDCAQNLKSIPSHFGPGLSLKIAALFQILCLFCLICFGMASHFFWPYFLSPLIACISFVRFHKKWNKDPRSLFISNVSVSTSTFLATITGCIWNVL